MLYVGLSRVSKSHMYSHSAEMKLIWETVQMMPAHLESLRVASTKAKVRAPSEMHTYRLRYP